MISAKFLIFGLSNAAQNSRMTELNSWTVAVKSAGRIGERRLTGNFLQPNPVVFEGIWIRRRSGVQYMSATVTHHCHSALVHVFLKIKELMQLYKLGNDHSTTHYKLASPFLWIRTSIGAFNDADLQPFPATFHYGAILAFQDRFPGLWQQDGLNQRE